MWDLPGCWRGMQCPACGHWPGELVYPWGERSWLLAMTLGTCGGQAQRCDPAVDDRRERVLARDVIPAATGELVRVGPALPHLPRELGDPRRRGAGIRK